MTNYKFKYTTQTIRQKGKIVYEYNPLYNYRLSKGTYLKDKEGIYLSKDLTKLPYAYPAVETLEYSEDSGVPYFKVPDDEDTYKKDLISRVNDIIKNIKTDWSAGFGFTKDPSELSTDSLRECIYPLVYEQDGIIQDLITGGDGNEDVLNFDLRHPVTISCQQSYDGSTNLILNDGKNIPRMINTRFTPLENNTYERIDRKGNTDTNLYDESEFDLDTSLTKRIKTIPHVQFNGLTYGGNLKVGLYHCYFKLADADGNESDFVAESFGIPVYIGSINTPNSIRGGQLDENSLKGFQLKLTNLDSSYDYVVVYYTRSSGASGVSPITTAYQIDQKYRIINSECEITVTGFETTQDIPVGDLQIEHFIPQAAKAQTLCQNMLMLGNVSKSTVPYDELQKLSLNFLPFYLATSSADTIGIMDENYDSSNGSWGYYNAGNVYSRVGYWPEEMYRFGVVYIMNDGTTSPVFNIRGIKELPNIEKIRVGEGENRYSPFYKDEKINIEEYKTASQNNPYTNPKSSTFVLDYDTYLIDPNTLENIAGVVKFPKDSIIPNSMADGLVDRKVDDEKRGDFPIYALAVKVSDSTLQELKAFGVKGYFIVRQKRIPTILGQAFTQGFEKNSGTPLLFLKGQADDKTDIYCTERFLCDDGVLPDDDFDPELIIFPQSPSPEVKVKAPTDDVLSAFCPEFDVNPGLFNAYLTGQKTDVKPVTDQLTLAPDDTFKRHFYCAGANTLNNLSPEADFSECNIVTIQDASPVVKSGAYTFRARCGNAEDLTYRSVVDKQSSDTYLPSYDNFATQKRQKKSFKKYIKKWAKATLALAVRSSVQIATGRIRTGTLSALASTATGIAATYYGVAQMESNKNNDYENVEGVNQLKVFIIRGLFGPYLGIYNNNSLKPGQIINIYYPGTAKQTPEEQFKIRFADASPYYTVSEHFEIKEPFDDGTLSTDSIFTVYSGDCYINTFTHRFNRNFSDPDAPLNDVIVDKRTWVDNWKDKNDNDGVNRGDVNAVQLGLWVTFQVRSSSNLYYRDTDPHNPSEESLFGRKRGFYPYQNLDWSGANKIPESQCYNQGFSKSVGDKLYTLLPNVPYIKNIFQTRIAFSLPALTDSFRNGLREFLMTSYKDYPIQYGGITTLKTVGKDLLVVFEHGVGTISVNQERLLKTDTVEIAVGAAQVLSEIKMLSDQFGSQWPESICQTDQYIYGVDTVAKKIWRVALSGYSGGKFETISDLSVQSFLVQNITLSERELTPIIGIRNVKTHYNANKHDVMFTYYDNLNGFEEKVWNLCYNELLSCFTTFYSWVPSYSANVYNSYFSYDRNASKWIAKLGMSTSGTKKEDGTFATDAEGVCVDQIELDKWSKA